MTACLFVLKELKKKKLEPGEENVEHSITEYVECSMSITSLTIKTTITKQNILFGFLLWRRDFAVTPISPLRKRNATLMSVIEFGS